MILKYVGLEWDVDSSTVFVEVDAVPSEFLLEFFECSNVNGVVVDCWLVVLVD